VRGDLGSKEKICIYIKLRRYVNIFMYLNNKHRTPTRKLSSATLHPPTNYCMQRNLNRLPSLHTHKFPGSLRRFRIIHIVKVFWYA